jgi:putative phosphoribosyl transferase
MSVAGAPYLNRTDAGRQLADRLESYRGHSTIVLALPRGGVPVASVIADRLGATLYILVVRKIGAPGNQEFGLGAVAEGGIRFLDGRLIRELGLRPEDLEAEVRVQTEAVDRLARRLRGGRPPPVLEGRTVVLVDDGMATGGTVQSAVQAVRLQRPSRLVLAVGVSSREAVLALRPLVDAVICPLIPRRLFAVGEWYREFLPVPDEEVVAVLQRHWAQNSAGSIRP